MNRLMCRLILSALLLVPAYSVARASIQRLTQIGPAYSTSNVTIAAISGQRNCISELTVTSDAAFDFIILNGGTTVYTVTMVADGGLVRSWDDASAICGGSNTAVYLNVTAGTFDINYSGFTR